MTAGDRLEAAAEARENVTRAIEFLKHPGVGALEESGVELISAIERIRQIQDSGFRDAGAGTAVQSALLTLRADLGRFRLLLSHAWEFRVGLTGQAGYSNQGALTPPAVSAGRWLFEG